MNTIYRCYVEKREGFDEACHTLAGDLGELLQISVDRVRILLRYDVQGISSDVYSSARGLVFSDPVSDLLYDNNLPDFGGDCRILAVEPLPGQFDQRADSCGQCIQLLAGGNRPIVRTATVYIFFGSVSNADFERVRAYLINPLEAREAASEIPKTLQSTVEIPKDVAVIENFSKMDAAWLDRLRQDFGLAMEVDDLIFMRNYFRSENRDPTVTELRVLDTYWSDHCRHTTFLTKLEQISIDDPDVLRAYKMYKAARSELYGDAADNRPETLMDMATIAAKLLSRRGKLPDLDVSDEINACSVRVKADIDGSPTDYLLMFKNETHNHPTEIEPFGGAATCIGGAIRDPLSGRSFVYHAMRVTGSGDPRVPLSETLPGKLPQRKLTTTAAEGYSSYGNQIGLATGLVREIYHPGYVAKRMEIGAVVGAAPLENVVRLEPSPGDAVILLGGRTGRDGCGGATGSSKSHTESSLDTCASEVQKGNAPEERKIQRLFRNPDVAKLIKRCNDFGAGGVSVAIGELAEGLIIELDKVPKKYDGLDGTELAISESQERMAVVVSANDVELLLKYADSENIEATQVATVTADPRLVMRNGGKVIVDIARGFLDSNGASKTATARVTAAPKNAAFETASVSAASLTSHMSDLRVCSQRGLIERFDSSIGSGSVLMPFGGKYQRTPSQVMAALLPSFGECGTCSLMSYSFDPYQSSADPFKASAWAVTLSATKLVSSGCDISKIWLTLQEYFPKHRNQPELWGLPVGALLGAMRAQLGLGIGAIGGKDSMSGSFGDLDVPPTLVSFAVSVSDADRVISGEFKAPDSCICVFEQPVGNKGLPDFDRTRAMWSSFDAALRDGKIKSAMTVERQYGASGTIALMSFGNGIGFSSERGLTSFPAGSIIAECDGTPEGSVMIGRTTSDGLISISGETVDIEQLHAHWSAPLEDVFRTSVKTKGDAPTISAKSATRAKAQTSIARPRAVIPAFPGTNCEYDTARAVERAGGIADIWVCRNLSADALDQSAKALEQAIRQSQMLILPGGFSAGDEPDGSGKFIAAFLRNPLLTEAIHDLLYSRDGLVLGICNGFQVLIKLGLLPEGKISDSHPGRPTLAKNQIGRHQSRYVYTRVSSAISPWLLKSDVGDVHAVPVSHGEGRFWASPEICRSLAENNQIAFQYTDMDGVASMDTEHNPNGSVWAIEGISSSDGRILGKMAHNERYGEHVAKNIPGNKNLPIFESGVMYYK